MNTEATSDSIEFRSFAKMSRYYFEIILQDVDPKMKRRRHQAHFAQ